MTNRVLIIFSVLFGFIHVANGIRCYSCNGATNSKCNDPFDKSAFTEANFGISQSVSGGKCLKTKASAAGVDVVVRSSFGSISCANDCSEIGIAGVSSVTCCCDTDLCNGVSTLRQYPMLIFAALVIVVKLWLH